MLDFIVVPLLGGTLIPIARMVEVGWPWGRVGCDIPGGVVRDGDFIADVQEDCLARYYHPVLILHEREDRRGWPSSADWYLTWSRLLFVTYAREAICSGYHIEIIPSGVPKDISLVAVERPVTLKCEDVLPRVIGTVRSNQKTPIPFSTWVPETSRFYGVWAGFRIGPEDNEEAQARILRGRSPTDAEQETPIYTHVYPNMFGGINIQYWYFFPWNGGIGWHEGDWEHITLRLDPSLNVQGVWYHHHSAKDFKEWNAISWITNEAGEHPLVYIAELTHASYWSDEACDSGNAGGDECPEAHALEWWPGLIGAPTDRPVYLGGGLQNLGERGFETFFWEHFGGTWGIRNAAIPRPGFV